MKLIAATNNTHKVIEFKRILEPLGYTVLSQKEAGIHIEVEETGETFEENAYLKAKSVYEASGLPTVADDSGIAVDALNGAPGVYSARYGGPALDDVGRYEKLLAEMENVPDSNRTARFVCAISLILSNEKVYSFTGVCEGKSDTPRVVKTDSDTILYLWWGIKVQLSFPQRKRIKLAIGDKLSAKWRNCSAKCRMENRTNDNNKTARCASQIC